MGKFKEVKKMGNINQKELVSVELMRALPDGREEIKLDFDRITGRVLINCERAAKKKEPAMTLPALSMTYQAYVAAEAASMDIDSILNLPAPDFIAVTVMVQNFLVNTEQRQA